MAAPKELIDLVERFERNVEAYRAGGYNETQARVEFINPLFELLGWDVANREGAAEDTKQVIHEDAVKIAGKTKAPDYSFGFGRKNRKFYLEAKKPSVQLKDDPAPALQLRRYTYSSQLPVGVLTDFEEFAVYDGRVRPDKKDKASTARILYLTYKDYAARWDELVATFSRDAAYKGAIESFAGAAKLKRGTTKVDEDFLRDIEAWRDLLARNIALRNKRLSQRDLNVAVQTTIDRLIFLRMCEDRGIETYGSLRRASGGNGVYRKLLDLFRQADERYNSGLFHFQKEKGRPEPDDLTPRLKIDDALLSKIIEGLYYPESPYEFSKIPPEILGHVYEKFLGKVIRLTAGHQARVEEKPEVKKAGGVYYTPAYIVDYIVKNTVGKFLEGKTPLQAVKLTVLDPACGSGSFLIAAYQYLLDWHRDWYAANDPVKWRQQIHAGPDGQWRLTTHERKRILLNHIHGVDIDPQAVEVTKLSLLLKVLEGESNETLSRQLQMFHERVLPDLAANIKCGNSLIANDFYAGKTLSLFDDDARQRINAFDWSAEFPSIMKSGGFDAVIGNPPWGQKEIATDDATKNYIWARYPSSSGIFDMFRPFIERAASLLNKGGYFAMVLPDIVLLKDYETTRRFLLDSLTLQAIDWWGMAFESAVIDACTIIGRNAPATENQAVTVNVRDPETPLCHVIRQEDFRRNPRSTFNLTLTEEKRRVVERLNVCPKVEEFFEIHEGVHSGNMRAELFVNRAVDKSCREMYFGRDEISRYFLRWNGLFIRIAAAPSRRTASKYANLGRPDWYDKDKLLVRRTGDYVMAAVDRSRRYASNNFFIAFPKKPSFLELDGMCALLNSRFITWYFRTIEPRAGRVFAELKIKHLGIFPLPVQVTQNDGCCELNDLGARRTALAKTGKSADESLQRQIDATDREIDRLVYELYGLTGAEIAIVEDQANGRTSA